MTRLPALAVAMFALLAHSLVLAQDPAKPAPPSEAVPDMRTTNPAVLCVECEQPFDDTTHKKILEGLLNNLYIGELRKALYLQDSVHQFESKIHFDNCDFDSAVTYIDSRLAEAGRYVEDAQKAKASGKYAAMQTAVRSAFFSLGQALHGVQDFYAHSNYVELSAPKVKRVTDMDVIAPWRPAGKARIKRLRQEGLVSGYVFWGFPQECPSGTLSHADLAKDSESMKSGKRQVPHLQNISQYRIAVYLAREDSQEFLRDAFRRWPLLKEVNGPNVAFEVLVDRRGL